VWAHSHAAHPDREAARLFAKVLGQIEAQGLAHVAAAGRALTAGTPLRLALTSPPAPVLAAVEVPSALRDLDVPSGYAAGYDGSLAEGRA
jgi:hypothetical protein